MGKINPPVRIHSDQGVIGVRIIPSAGHGDEDAPLGLGPVHPHEHRAVGVLAKGVLELLDGRHRLAVDLLDHVALRQALAGRVARGIDVHDEDPIDVVRDLGHRPHPLGDLLR